MQRKFIFEIKIIAKLFSGKNAIPSESIKGGKIVFTWLLSVYFWFLQKIVFLGGSVILFAFFGTLCAKWVN